MQKIKERVWEYILGYDVDYGFVPSLSQIQHHFKWSNKMSAKYYTDMLVREGKLKRVEKPHFVYYKLINKEK